MKLKAQTPSSYGCHEIFRPGQESGLKGIGLEILHLEKGTRFTGDSQGDEIAIVSISSTADFHSEMLSAKLNRKDVFSERASLVCLPSNTEFQINAQTDSTFAICRAIAGSSFKPFVLGPENGTDRTVGTGVFQRRVSTLLGTESPCQRLVLGETFNQLGSWSSFPPHKHDRDIPNEEVTMEEIYYFKVKPSNGFGFQRIYTEDGSIDEAITLLDQTAVAIPRGYHPVCVMPGHEIYYLWFLAGNGRKLIPFTDPNFKWLEASR